MTVPAKQTSQDESSVRPGDLRATERIRRAGGGPGGAPHGGGSVGEKAHDFRTSGRRLVGQLKPERARLVAVGLLTLMSVLLSALGPRLLGHATDLVMAGLLGSRLTDDGEVQASDVASNLDVTPGQGVDFSAVGQVLLVVMGLFVMGAVLAWLASFVLNGVVQGVVRRMRSDVERKIHVLPLSYFDRQPRGELLSRATNDIDNVAQSLQQTLSQLLTALLTVVATITMMCVISPLLALIALVSVPLTMIVAGQVMKRSQKLFIAQWRQTGLLNGHIEESFSGHTLVRVFGRRKQAQQRFREVNDELYDAAWSAQFVSGLIMPITMFVGNLNYVAVAVVGALRVTSGHLTLGEVQAFIQYTRQFNQPISQVASMANLLQSGVASAERVFEVLDAPEEIEPADGPDLVADGPGEVRLEHVDFAYDVARPLIENLSLVARTGRTVAIVGPTGAGKTTLVNLVMRYYDVTGGRILLDGVDIATVSRAALRSKIGMVLQDTWLFAGTIAENIAYGRPDATRDDIVSAARATFVDRFVHTLPDGYETILEEDGANLSAGERQLITIARAFLVNPSLLILDEATSSVDTRTERLLQKAMTALRADRTSFVIAHRLSTVRDADLIVVMEAGRIVEQGTHAGLLAREGAYARLSAAQFAGAADAG